MFGILFFFGCPVLWIGNPALNARMLQLEQDRVWPIITNVDALAVSESWIGHPGTCILTAMVTVQLVIVSGSDRSIKTGWAGWMFQQVDTWSHVFTLFTSADSEDSKLSISAGSGTSGARPL